MNSPGNAGTPDLPSSFQAPPGGTGGQHYWRSIEELTATDPLRSLVLQEFPHLADVWHIPVKRREALKLMAASLALAGLQGCGRQPEEEIVPYVRAPEQLASGKPLHYATALRHGGFALGVLVESHMGRPTKVEGNELHPASLGATDAFAQAAVLGLYDPDRSQMITNAGEPSNWDAFLADIAAKRAEWASRQGAGLYLLSGTVTSPTLGLQLTELLQAYPQMRWHQYEPVTRDAVHAGAELAFGELLETLYRFDQATVIVSLDSDFLGSQAGHIRYAGDFAQGRRRLHGGATMNRLYVLESTPTLTGAMADHRLPLQATRVEAVARAMARKLGLDVTPSPEPQPIPEQWLETMVKDLRSHPANSLITVGDHQPPSVHALAHAMNERLGNFGHTVIHTEAIEQNPTGQWGSLRRLAEDVQAGKVDTLLILGGNPVFDAPVDLAFADALRKIPLRIHWGLYADETAQYCHWHVPACHDLESWGDGSAHDGTIALLQPLLAPLYGGRSIHELMDVLLGGSGRSDYDCVRSYWQQRYSGADFEHFWRQVLRDGLVADSAARPRQLSVRKDLASRLPVPARLPDQTLEIQFRPDPTVWDGRYANNGWLQELPKPLTKLTWSNAALISPPTAERLGLRNEEWVELSYRGRRLHTPVWIMPGQADDSVTLHLGYGRNRAGRVGNGVGVNASELRCADAPWFGFGLKINKVDAAGLFRFLHAPERVELATTQHHHGMAGHDLVRIMTAAEFQAATANAAKAEPLPSMYPPHRYEGNAWGMVIDQNVCIGCNACVLACQAENNIPIVGKEQVIRGREMHWLRIDRYYTQSPHNPRVFFQPVPCMQCERAPCEPVCPVHASVHDGEGINNQVYNRCVGTRTCQSNCPYKVRRFNFFDYAHAPATNEGAPNLAALRNPEVTVRSRGVMEKCTYCIQRISAARIEAEKQNRPLADGEVVTACQAACPTRAIVFGNINDPESRVAKLKSQPHHYALLAELDTNPRTTYLAKLCNPNPELDHG